MGRCSECGRVADDGAPVSDEISPSFWEHLGNFQSSQHLSRRAAAVSRHTIYKLSMISSCSCLGSRNRRTELNRGPMSSEGTRSKVSSAVGKPFVWFKNPDSRRYHMRRGCYGAKVAHDGIPLKYPSMEPCPECCYRYVLEARRYEHARRFTVMDNIPELQ